MTDGVPGQERSGGPPLILALDRAALAANWYALNAMSGRARAGAAVKADGYGLGARAVVPILAQAGCRDFYVATWAEAAELTDIIGDASLSVLNGVRAADMAAAVAAPANCRPVLSSIAQAQRWRETKRPCDVMINSGMNRLGIDPEEALAFDWSGFDIATLMSHLASADEDCSQNREQLTQFHAVTDHIPHRERSLANSAGIALGPDYHFDLTRPGLSLYGGVPRSELNGHIQQLTHPRAQILQRRSLTAGAKIGYNSTFTAPQPMLIAIVAIGYADGYGRVFSNCGQFTHAGRPLPVLGRVSMDLVILDINTAPELDEGDWVELPFSLPTLSEQSGLSQYELLTGWGRRAERIWR
jgi:alanine racemase